MFLELTFKIKIYLICTFTVSQLFIAIIKSKINTFDGKLINEYFISGTIHADIFIIDAWYLNVSPLK